MLLNSYSFVKGPVACVITSSLEYLSPLDHSLTCLPGHGLSAAKPSMVFTPVPRLLTLLEEKQCTAMEVGCITNCEFQPQLGFLLWSSVFVSSHSLTLSPSNYSAVVPLFWSPNLLSSSQNIFSTKDVDHFSVLLTLLLLFPPTPQISFTKKKTSIYTPWTLSSLKHREGAQLILDW